MHGSFLRGWREPLGHPPPPNGWHKHAGKMLHFGGFGPRLFTHARPGNGKPAARHGEGISDAGSSPEQQTQRPAWQGPAPPPKLDPLRPSGPALHPHTPFV